MTKYREILGKRVLPDGMASSSEEAQDWILEQLLQEIDIQVDPQTLASEIARLEAYDSHVLQQELLQSGDFSLLLPENRQKRKMEIREEAERAAKTEALLHFIAAEEHIVVTAEEREAEAQRIARQDNIPLEDIRKFMGNSFEMLQEDLVLAKTLHWLCTHIGAQ